MLVIFIIFIILAVNIVTALVFRSRRGQLRVAYEESNPNFPALLLIAGFKSQPEVAFSEIYLLGYNLYCLQYSNFGFDLVGASRQVNHLRQETNGTVVAIGMGTKIAIRGWAKDAILINPYLSPTHIKDKATLERLTKRAPWLHALSVALGWAGFLPIIKVGMVNGRKVRYSVALLADQMIAVISEWPVRTTVLPVRVVFSEHDSLVDNVAVAKIFPKSEAKIIDAGHADTVSAHVEYERAIQPFLY